MSSLLASIARYLTAHWKRGLLGLIAGVVIVGAVVGSQTGTAAQDFTIPGAESQKALDVLKQKFPQASGATSQIVFTTSAGRLTDAAKRAAVEGALSRVRALAHVSGVADPLAGRGGQLGRDGRTALATVQYDRQAIDLTKADGQKLEDTARSAARGGVEVQLRGEVIDLAAQQSAPVGELVGIAIAVLLLTLLFRSGAAMFVTLVGALVGVALSQLILAAVSAPLGIPDFAKTIAIMLGLGAGIDYALLIFSRFREQLVQGDSAPEAAARANATSGVSVVAAGAIVMVAIAGLLAVGIPLVGKMGIGAAIAIAMVVLSSITVLPIFAGMLSKRLYPKDPAHVAHSERFMRWGEVLVRRPWRAVIGGGLVLVLLAVPLMSMRLGQPDDGNKPAGDTSRKAYDQLSAAFGPGSSGPLLLAADAGGGAGARVDPAQLKRVAGAIGAAGGVARVSPPVVNRARDAAILQVIPRTSPQDQRTADLVDHLRADVIPAAVRGTPLHVYVGGQTASIEDFSAKISSRLPLFIGIVIGLSILLLMAVFRSIWVPLASAAFNLLSIGAAYGVIVAVFQWNWGASVLGVGSNVPVVSFVPLMMFAILFGLSMDYNVFLLSRIREAYFEGDAPAESVVHGLSRIAKVILAAGLIMASVFLAFISGGDVVVKMFGLGLGAAILIDVLVVRMVISPALMALLGDRAWWFPRWLDRALPDVSLEGGHEGRGKRRLKRRRPVGA